MTASSPAASSTTRETFGDALAAGFELVMTPAIFAFFGFLIDRQVGTWPIFTLVLGAVVLAYEVWKLVHWYNAELDRALVERRAAFAADVATRDRIDDRVDLP